MNILITGANGYVGKSLVTYYKSHDNINVTALTRQDVDLIDSKAVTEFLKDKSYDVVLHCAVKGGSRLEIDEHQIIYDNLIMFNNLISNRERFGKLIHFGSGAEVYMPNTPYGLSKSLIRNKILELDNMYSLRIYGVFDENELITRFIKANILRYIKKEPISIHANKYMDFFYMNDLITLVDHYISSSDLPKEVECRYPNVVDLKFIGEFINTLSDYKVPIDIGSQFGGCYIGNSLPPDLGYLGLEHGIRNVYTTLQ